MDKVERLQALVDSADTYTMRSGKSRQAFGKLLARELGLWEPPVIEFVHDMHGLNFYNREDRKAFFELFLWAYAFSA